MLLFELALFWAISVLNHPFVEQSLSSIIGWVKDGVKDWASLFSEPLFSEPHLQGSSSRLPRFEAASSLSQLFFGPLHFRNLSYCLPSYFVWAVFPRLFLAWPNSSLSYLYVEKLSAFNIAFSMQPLNSAKSRAQAAVPKVLCNPKMHSTFAGLQSCWTKSSGCVKHALRTCDVAQRRWGSAELVKRRYI